MWTNMSSEMAAMIEKQKKIDEYEKNSRERRERRSENFKIACPKFEKLLRDEKVLFIDLRNAINFDDCGHWWPRYEVFHTTGYDDSVERTRFYIWPQESFNRTEECPRGYIRHLEIHILLNNLSKRNLANSVLAIWAADEDEWAFKPIRYLSKYLEAAGVEGRKLNRSGELKRAIRLVPATSKEKAKIANKYKRTLAQDIKRDPPEGPYNFSLGDKQILHEKYTMLERDEMISALARFTDYEDGWKVRFKAGINILYRIGDLWR